LSGSVNIQKTDVRPAAKRRRFIYGATCGGIVVQGGMATMARYMVDEWKRAGRQPELVLLNTYGPNLSNIATMPFYFGAAVATVTANGILGRISVLHLHMAEYGSVLRKGILGYIGKTLNIPVVIHMHGAKFGQMWDAASPGRRKAILGVLRRADAIVVLGQFWKQYLINDLGLPPEKVHVVANGVPDPGVAPKPLKQNAKVSILFAGQVGQRKGVGDLLQALAKPAVRALDWELVIAGSGEIEAHTKLAQELGIGDRVRFLGWVDLQKVSELMRLADIFVLPSYLEGLPMAILEAMANGLPVVTTPVGAIPDMITDGETGLLAPAGNVDALSGAFLRLLASPELRVKIGAAARQRYLRNFTVSAMCDGLETVFSDVSAKR
jgi:glycosyltransferase involved in cell wall biosynthesis